MATVDDNKYVCVYVCVLCIENDERTGDLDSFWWGTFRLHFANKFSKIKKR